MIYSAHVDLPREIPKPKSGYQWLAKFRHNCSEHNTLAEFLKLSTLRSLPPLSNTQQLELVKCSFGRAMVSGAPFGASGDDSGEQLFLQANGDRSCSEGTPKFLSCLSVPLQPVYTTTHRSRRATYFDLEA